MFKANLGYMLRPHLKKKAKTGWVDKVRQNSFCQGSGIFASQAVAVSVIRPQSYSPFVAPK